MRLCFVVIVLIHYKSLILRNLSYCVLGTDILFLTQPESSS